MVDPRTDSLIRRLDVDLEPDASFEASSLASLLPNVRRARREDATVIGRIRRDLRSPRTWWAGSPSQRVAVVGVAALLALLVIAALILLTGATRTTPLGNGRLVLVVNGELHAIDMTDGSSRVIASFGGPVAHVSRSPDGRLVSGWRKGREGDELLVAGLDGEAPRRVAADSPGLVPTGCIDQWSPGSRLLATSVTTQGLLRILVVDTATGVGTFVTGPDVEAQCQVWSTDGKWLAVNEGPAGGPHVIAIVHPDGTGLRVVSTDLDRIDAEGVNSWSPDGAWIYFGADRSVWRTNVLTRTSERLTDPRIFAVAPALSPDGTRLAYIVDTPTNWDLWVANPDGTHPKRVLKNARNNGWSADGHYILARWLPPDEPGGLTLVSPDGSGFRLVVPAVHACPDPDQGCDMDWGQPKP